MEKYSDMLHFSRDLFLYYTEILVPAEAKAALSPSKFMEAATLTLKTFCDAFSLKLDKAYKKHAFEVVNTDEQFLRYTIPRCLKLVDDYHYYFSFMLVAAFITKLLQYLETRRDCYRFSGTAYKCLVAVFKRRFEGDFEENGGWKGLRSFCDEIAYVENPRKKMKTKADFLTGGNRMRKKQVFKLIKKCDFLYGESFTLNDYELTLTAMDDVIEAELNNFVKVANGSPLEVEWTMFDDNEIFQVLSRFEDETGRVISTRVRQSFTDAVTPGVLDSSSDVKTPAVLNFSSDKNPEVLDSSSAIKTSTVLDSSLDVETRPALDSSPDVETLDSSTDVETLAALDSSPDVETLAALDSSPDVETLAALDSSPDIKILTALDSMPDIETPAVQDSKPDVKSLENLDSPLDFETPTVLDLSADVDISALLDSSVDVETPAVFDLSSEAESLSSLDFDSDDVDLEKIACDRFAHRIVYEILPKEFDQKMSTRICEWCDTRCFQRAKYLFGKHTELSVKPKKLRAKFFKPRFLKAILTIFSRNTRF